MGNGAVTRVVKYVAVNRWTGKFGEMKTKRCLIGLSPAGAMKNWLIDT